MANESTIRPRRPRPSRKPPLTVQQILKWADAHRKRTGEFPTASSGPVSDAPRETWAGSDRSLRVGRRGLPSGSSLARLLFEKRGKRNHRALPPYTIEEILDWAYAHFKRTGKYPRQKTGKVSDAPGETWSAIHCALSEGMRGLAGGSTLLKLLEEHRGFTPQPRRPPLTVRRIVAWADFYFARHGRWPTQHSGAIVGAGGETWRSVNRALYCGIRGLNGRSSLPRLLAERRGVRNVTNLRPLTVRQILAWADTHQRRTGKFPKVRSGAVAGADGEKWSAIERALIEGYRGLPGGSSLAKLLAEHREARNHRALPPLTVKKILDWADAHFEATGRWPTQYSGAVDGAHGQTWSAVQQALVKGCRGLPGGSSLARLLARHRGRRHWHEGRELSVARILQWCDAHFRREGRWPNVNSGAVRKGSEGTWRVLDAALRQGHRGLPGGSSLAALLDEHRPISEARAKKPRKSMP